jgi:hypothetical protein
MTEYLYRVFLIVPDERKDNLNDFIKEEFDSADWLVVPLSETGEEPASHFATCFACTHAQTDKWANRLANDGGVPLPNGFAQFTPDQRIAFMTAARETLRENTGTIVYVCRNDQEWFNVEEILESENLKRVTPAQV